MRIICDSEVPELTRALFLHVISYLNTHFSRATAPDQFEVKSLEIVKDTIPHTTELCRFRVDRSLVRNYVITMWYLGYKALVITTKVDGDDIKIIKFLNSFPDVRER